jgi:hypothetical protein
LGPGTLFDLLEGEQDEDERDEDEMIEDERDEDEMIEDERDEDEMIEDGTDDERMDEMEESNSENAFADKNARSKVLRSPGNVVSRFRPASPSVSQGEDPNNVTPFAYNPPNTLKPAIPNPNSTNLPIPTSSDRDTEIRAVTSGPQHLMGSAGVTATEQATTDLPTTSCKRQGRGSTVPDRLPSRLPCWNWEGNSCSLDSVMLMAMNVILRHPRECQALDGDKSSTAFKALHVAVTGWNLRGSWMRFDRTLMEGVRNTCRDMMEENGIIIDMTSTINLTHDYFIPAALCEFTIIGNYRCSNPKCAGLERKGKTNQERYTQRSRTISRIGVNYKWLKDSNSQALIDEVVHDLLMALTVAPSTSHGISSHDRTQGSL